MKILIAGGAGFIGSHLCEKLLAENHYVICVDNLLTGSFDNIKHLKNNPNFIFIKTDIIEKLPPLSKIEAIFHLASPASPNEKSPISYHTLAEETIKANIDGTWQLLELAKKEKARFLFASTSEIYGNPLVSPQNENYFGNVNPLGKRAVYDESKRMGETLTFYYYRKKGVNVRIARIFNTYGPRMRIDDQRMVVNFIINALKNKPIEVYGDGNQTRSLCYISDMIDGLVKLMFAPNTNGEVINLGNSSEKKVIDYAQLIKKLTQSKSKIVITNQPIEDDPERRCPDITKAKKILEWEPKISLIDGLKLTIDYYKKII